MIDLLQSVLVYVLRLPFYVLGGCLASLMWASCVIIRILRNIAACFSQKVPKCENIFTTGKDEERTSPIGYASAFAVSAVIIIETGFSNYLIIEKIFVIAVFICSALAFGVSMAEQKM